MDSTMQRVIKYFFQKDQEGIARHLMLTGFNYDDRKKLPANWRVTMTQFDPDWIGEPGLMSIPPPEYLDDDKNRRMPSSNVCNVTTDN